MAERPPSPPAPRSLAEYATQFDDRLGMLARRRGSRAFLQGLLLPPDRHKTVTGQAGAGLVRCRSDIGGMQKYG